MFVEGAGQILAGIQAMTKLIREKGRRELLLPTDLIQFCFCKYQALCLQYELRVSLHLKKHVVQSTIRSLPSIYSTTD
jgi:hypothetical protein